MNSRPNIFYLLLVLASCAKATQDSSTDVKISFTSDSGKIMSASAKGYWVGFDASTSGDTLKLTLHNKIKDHKVIRYTQDSITPPAGYDFSVFGDIQNYLNNFSLTVNDRFDVWDYFIGIAVMNANPGSITCQASKRIYDFYSGNCYVPAGTYTGMTTNINAPSLFQVSGTQQEQNLINREHSWPSSWFNPGVQVNNPSTGDYCFNGNSDSSYLNFRDYRAYTDIHHLLPTESSANGIRSNNPYGYVNTASNTYAGSGIRAATPATGGRSGTPHHSNITQGAYTVCGAAADQVPCTATTVFEPPDHLKGDIARIYFYMSTRYYLEDNCWQNMDAVNKANIKPWQEKMLRQWHANDPVDAGEIAKNDLIQRIQGNRNPFIDHPEWVEKISDF